MKAAFDTNILIDYLNGFEAASKELSLYDNRIISIITYIEVLAGAGDTEEERMIRGFLSSFTIRELSRSIADISIVLRKRYSLRVPDAIVYATARDEGCLMVSRNTRDLKQDWPDIRVPYKL
jgi:predicted nucleic acid-binding protein